MPESEMWGLSNLFVVTILGPGTIRDPNILSRNVSNISLDGSLAQAANYCLRLALDDSKDGMLNHKAGSFMDDGNRLFLWQKHDVNIAGYHSSYNETNVQRNIRHLKLIGYQFKTKHKRREVSSKMPPFTTFSLSGEESAMGWVLLSGYALNTRGFKYPRKNTRRLSFDDMDPTPTQFPFRNWMERKRQ